MLSEVPAMTHGLQRLVFGVEISGASCVQFNLVINGKLILSRTIIIMPP